MDCLTLEHEDILYDLEAQLSFVLNKEMRKANSVWST